MKTGDLDKLKQHDEPVIKSHSTETDIADIFAPFVESIDSFIDDDSLITPVAPQDIQYLWFDKRRLCKPRVLKKVHTDYDWNQYYKQHHNTDNPPSSSPSRLFIQPFISISFPTCNRSIVVLFP
jgi:hypothetical protein